MRAVVQRVDRAAVRVEGAVTGSIGPGLLVLLGVEASDTAADREWLVGKIARLRIFPDEAGRMNRSVADCGLDCLVVSQFTLFASTKKGNRPAFTRAAPPALAIPAYEAFVTSLAEAIGRPVPTGVFGEHMDVELVNDGPVTIVIDSRNRE